MAPTADGPDSSFPEFPVIGYFCWGADPPGASRSAKVLRLVFAEGSDAHFLCRGTFSLGSSLFGHFCPVAGNSRASIFLKLSVV